MKRIGLILFLALILFSINSEAKISNELRTSFEAVYIPSLPQRGLETAVSPVNPRKLRGFAVVEIGGLIPAARAKYFIEPSTYDYRGAEVEGSRIKTRMGRPYVYLDRGTLMAVAGIVYSGRHIYVKLQSAEKIRSKHNPKLKPTRVTVMLGIKFSKDVLKNNEISPIIAAFEEWIKPFSTYEQAIKYSYEIKDKVPEPLPDPVYQFPQDDKKRVGPASRF